uniref:Uncharacterized protein n=1 Tax=Sinocyclocheilus anshuiensis TaxID=1608454 RepID=A0A671KK18_9TELE
MKILTCALTNSRHSTQQEAPYIIMDETNINPEVAKLLGRIKYVARSCKEIREKYHVHDGMIVSIYFCYLKHQTAFTGNPGYFDIGAQDVSVWHVPNNSELEHWTTAAILRYHTENQFLTLHGGNLFKLFKKFPVRFGIGTCNVDNGPAIPIVYDTGNAISTKYLSSSMIYFDFFLGIFEPGFITFRVFNTEKFCIGGGGHFPESARQCGDFTSFDWNGYGTNTEWSASKEITEAAVLLFYR